VEVFDQIRRDRRPEGLSIRALAERCRVHRRRSRGFAYHQPGRDDESTGLGSAAVDVLGVLIDRGQLYECAGDGAVVMADNGQPVRDGDSLGQRAGHWDAVSTSVQTTVV
jgi:hypothetical protein